MLRAASLAAATDKATPIAGLAAVEFFSEVPHQGLRNRVRSQYFVGERDRVCRNGVSQKRVWRIAFENHGWAIKVFRVQVRLKKILRCIHPDFPENRDEPTGATMTISRRRRKRPMARSRAHPDGERRADEILEGKQDSVTKSCG